MSTSVYKCRPGVIERGLNLLMATQRYRSEYQRLAGAGGFAWHACSMSVLYGSYWPQIATAPDLDAAAVVWCEPQAGEEFGIYRLVRLRATAR